MTNLSNSRGGILILVLWTLFFLSIFAASLGRRAYQDINVAAYLGNQAQARYIAEAGVKAAAALVKNDANPYDALNELWHTGCATDDSETIFKEKKFGNGVYSIFSQLPTVPADAQGDSVEQLIYGMIDEERKININTASVEVLEKLFYFAAKVDQPLAHRIANSILDWRDTDSDARDGGAEDMYYQFLKKPYACKDGNFQIIEELLFIKGMTPEIFDKTERYLTLYGDGRININTADSLVLESLGISEVLIKKILNYRQGVDHKIGTGDDHVFKDPLTVLTALSNIVPLTLGESATLDELITKKYFSVNSQNYSGYIEVKMRRRSEKVKFVVQKEKGIQYWHEL